MNRCILFFDDDPEILLVCKIILEQDNYRVETRTRCDNIIEDIKEVKPGLILMDVWIPEIGGEQAIHLMKDNKETQHLPVILFSANAEIEEICQRSNANGFLKKPFDVIALKKIIEENIVVPSGNVLN
ncbi:MAG TPA: response regulator [Chitinophagaceae bacterium]|jgi:DNA-binding NtrC family response regulator